uniref:C-type lectin domain-containing protein n=1 Tax=Monopterus albus TaxID=43700 RepID=A0A3Q3R8T3_MONAL
DERNVMIYTGSSNDQPSFCPSHWVPYGGNCYYLVRDKKMWRDALAACHREGGDLASIHNIEEQSFIISQTGYCKCAVNEWMWIDNSAVDYTNWKTGMPKLESCVDINSDSGKWSTNSCRLVLLKGACRDLLTGLLLTPPSEGTHPLL